MSIGALQAHAARGSARDVTVLQIDAHLDMRDDDSDYNDRDPSRYAHSCVMRRARELGFRTCSVGIRAYARDEYRYAERERLPVFEWGKDGEPPIEAILAAIRTERVYLTLDVDGFDPAVAPATGTPVPGGLSWAYGTRLLRELFLRQGRDRRRHRRGGAGRGLGADRVRRRAAVLRHARLQAAEAGRPVGVRVAAQAGADQPQIARGQKTRRRRRSGWRAGATSP